MTKYQENKDTMEVLKEIVKVLTPKRISYVSLLSNQLNSDSKIMQLYQGIQSGKIVDRTSAISFLYPNDVEGKSKFSKLKYHFKKRAISTILLVEINNDDGKKERKKAFFDCLRTFVIAYFLIMLHARKAGIQLLQQKLKTMHYYDFTFLCLESAKILRQHYATIVGDFEKVELYNQIVMDYMSLYVLETKAEGYFYQLMGFNAKEATSQTFLHHVSTQYLEELPGELPTNASSSLIYKFKMIELIQCMSNHEYRKGINICKASINQLSSKEFKDFTALSILYFQWISCCLYLGEHEACKPLVKKLIQYLNEGEVNWFKGLQVLAKVSFYIQDYESALHYYIQVKKHKNFRKLSDETKENWLIYEGYLHVLMFFGRLQFSADFEQRVIRLQKFLNSVPLAQRDKQGMNIAIRIYWILISIHQRKYIEVIEKSEALQKYISRYLKEEGYERTRVFLKMLIYLCRSNYDYDLAKNKIDKLQVALRSSKKQRYGEEKVVEIIPYEYLWNMLLSRSKQSKRDQKDQFSTRSNMSDARLNSKSL
ncbi:MAG: hypothetical protein AAF849_17575 [Bacteroidota bacterium]